MKLKQTLILFLLSISSINAESTPTIQVIISSDNSIYEQALFGLQTSLQREIKVDYYDLILKKKYRIKNIDELREDKLNKILK